MKSYSFGGKSRRTISTENMRAKYLKTYARKKCAKRSANKAASVCPQNDFAYFESRTTQIAGQKTDQSLKPGLLGISQ